MDGRILFSCLLLHYPGLSTVKMIAQGTTDEPDDALGNLGLNRIEAVAGSRSGCEATIGQAMGRGQDGLARASPQRAAVTNQRLANT
jgi:hypothetical protein